MSLRPTSAKKVIKALLKIGFNVVRRRGSYVMMKHPDGRITVIPYTRERRLVEGYS